MISYKNISPHLRNAVLIAEDSAFFQTRDTTSNRSKNPQSGIGEKTIRAGPVRLRSNWQRIFISSTSKNPLRKIQEFVIAQEMERAFEAENLEIYLNVIEWGDAIYGIEPAAQSVLWQICFNLVT
jgi:monofunctional biosynthetic peptidoglycan transglycosylase